MGNRSYALHKACPELRSAYDSCEVRQWDAFRRGTTGLDNSGCRDEWEDYRSCVQRVWDDKTADFLRRRQQSQSQSEPHRSRSKEGDEAMDDAAVEDVSASQPSLPSSSSSFSSRPSS